MKTEAELKNLLADMRAWLRAEKNLEKKLNKFEGKKQ
jgi:hypothetical protein